MAKMIGFRPNARDEAMIEAERQRLVEYHMRMAGHTLNRE
jgi:hypothetical protein